MDSGVCRAAVRGVTESDMGKGSPLQYSCLENPVESGACRAAVRGVTQSQTRLSDSHFHFADVRFPYGNS